MRPFYLGLDKLSQIDTLLGKKLKPCWKLADAPFLTGW
jgi:hypothetical protein